MNLRFTDEQEAFRAEARAWLRANVPQGLPSPGTREGFQAHHEWERALSRAGYAGLRWPVELGGRGADVVHQAIFEEEYLLANGPERITVLGQNLMGPTLMAHGTEDQKRRWLPGIISAEEIWSQGFSEPDAGSDLAGIRTRATVDGDTLVVNGQKVWTSYGAFADWMFALVRTDPEAARHAGISFLALDMASGGIEVRPLVQLDGHAGFAEVFFSDVRVPRANLVGEINAGWEVAMTTLGFERDAPAAPAARYRRDLADLVAIARARNLADDPVVADALAHLYVRAETYRLHTLRTLTRLARGESLGAEASMTKLLWSELEQAMFERGMELMGPFAETFLPARDAKEWNARYWHARAATIYAGTSEIQRNIIAERVLGLPRG